MYNNNLEQLKQNYEQGFRCIRAEEQNNQLTIYLKNFDTERINTIASSDPSEMQQLTQYISSMTQ